MTAFAATFILVDSCLSHNEFYSTSTHQQHFVRSIPQTLASASMENNSQGDNQSSPSIEHHDHIAPHQPIQPRNSDATQHHFHQSHRQQYVRSDPDRHSYQPYSIDQHPSLDRNLDGHNIGLYEQHESPPRPSQEQTYPLGYPLYERERNHVHGPTTVGHFRHNDREREHHQSSGKMHDVSNAKGTMNSGIPDGISNGSGGKYGGPPEDYRHVRIRSAPHSLHSQTQSNSELTHRRPQSAHISHHPNAINRYPFSIPSVSAKLDQPHHADGSDALSSLWKVRKRRNS